MVLEIQRDFLKHLSSQSRGTEKSRKRKKLEVVSCFIFHFDSSTEQKHKAFSAHYFCEARQQQSLSASLQSLYWNRKMCIEIKVFLSKLLSCCVFITVGSLNQSEEDPREACLPSFIQQIHFMCLKKIKVNKLIFFFFESKMSENIESSLWHSKAPKWLHITTVTEKEFFSFYFSSSSFSVSSSSSSSFPSFSSSSPSSSSSLPSCSSSFLSPGCCPWPCPALGLGFWVWTPLSVGRSPLSSLEAAGEGGGERGGGGCVRSPGDPAEGVDFSASFRWELSWLQREICF